MYSDKTKDDNDSVETKYRQLGIIPGLGLYFHVFTNSIMDISLGPKFKSFFYFTPSMERKPYEGNKSETKYEKFREISLRFMLQLNIDLLVSNRLDLRLTTSLIKYRYYKLNYKYKKSDTEQTNKDSDLDITSFFKPSFGFQLRF